MNAATFPETSSFSSPLTFSSTSSSSSTTSNPERRAIHVDVPFGGHLGFFRGSFWKPEAETWIDEFLLQCLDAIANGADFFKNDNDDGKIAATSVATAISENDVKEKANSTVPLIVDHEVAKKRLDSNDNEEEGKSAQPVLFYAGVEVEEMGREKSDEGFGTTDTTSTEAETTSTTETVANVGRGSVTTTTSTTASTEDGKETLELCLKDVILEDQQLSSADSLVETDLATLSSADSSVETDLVDLAESEQTGNLKHALNDSGIVSMSSEEDASTLTGFDGVATLDDAATLDGATNLDNVVAQPV